MEVYFKANSTTKKFYNTPPAFLDLMQELFNKVLATGSYIRLINKIIKSFINPKLLLIAASQASGLVDKEDKEEAEEAKETKETTKIKEEVNKASKLKLA